MNKFKQGDLRVNVTFNAPAKQLTLEVTTTLPVNRKDVYGWIFSDSPKGRALADRLANCIRGGKAFDVYEINTDVNGQTYVSAKTTGFFHKRHMNSELRKLGY